MPEQDLFNILEKHVVSLKNRDSLLSAETMAVAVQVIYQCAHKKANVVALDAKEAGGIRTLLNLGHSIGHAIETLMMPGIQKNCTFIVLKTS